MCFSAKWTSWCAPSQGCCEAWLRNCRNTSRDTWPSVCRGCHTGGAAWCTARPLSRQGPTHVTGGHAQSHTQSGESSGEKEAHSHSNCTKPGGCPGRSLSNSPFIHLVLKPLQAPLSSGTSRPETKTEGSWAEWGEGEKMGLGLDVLEVNLAACGYEATCYQLH